MLKKAFFAVLLVTVTLTGCKKEPPKSTYVSRPRPEPTEQAAPELPPADQLGNKTTFELTYRGITGKDDDIEASGGWGFGGRNEESSFTQAVRDKAENDLYVSHNFYLYDRPLAPIEYKGKEILYAYFDLNADGELSDDERLSPATGLSERYNRNEGAVFITPDFTVTNEQGQKTPFRVELRAYFYGESKKLSVTWGMMGVYEGTADLNGQSMRLYLFPDFSSQCYTKYSRSRYALVPASKETRGYISRKSFSSLIVSDNGFYRMTVDDVNPEARTIKVSLIEDKTPRGKVALDIKSKDEMKSKLSYASLHGETDKTIHFNLREGMNELPAGDYTISNGSFGYGKKGARKHSASFKGIPAFTIKTDETTTVELGRPEVKIQAVEENKRHHSDKTYKTTFPEDTQIYLDATFVGLAKETYSSFRQRVKKEGHTQMEDLKARIRIADSQGKEVINKELEYG